MEQYPKVLIYCGVNRGGTLQHLVSFFDLVIGFEPNPDAFNHSYHYFSQFSHVKLIPAALADFDGQIDFQVYKDDAICSVAKITDEWAETHQHVNQEFVKTIKVPAIHLGNFIDKMNFKDIDLLITDLQGLDLTVLKTVEKHIKNKLFHQIICEVELDDFPMSYQNLYNKEAGFKELLGDYYEEIERKGEAHWEIRDIRWKRI